MTKLTNLFQEPESNNCSHDSDFFSALKNVRFWQQSYSEVPSSWWWHCTVQATLLSYGQLCERPRWTESALWLATRTLKTALSCLLGIIRCVPQENSNQAYLVKMAGCWPCSFLHVYWLRPCGVEVHKHFTKKELRQYLAIVTARLVNGPYLLYGSVSQGLVNYCIKLYGR